MAKLKGKEKARARENNRQAQKNRRDAYISRLKQSVRTWDDPVLYSPCTPVGMREEDCSEGELIFDKRDDIQKKEIEKYIDKLKKVLAVHDNGVGLSLPQIGISKNIIAYRNLDRLSKIEIIIDPVVKDVSEEMTIDKEGCLSFPGKFVKIERHKEITISFFDEKYKLREHTFKDFLARIVQHEIDHLNGICKVSGNNGS